MSKIFPFRVQGQSGGGVAVGGVVRHMGGKREPLSIYVTQWSRNLSEKGDQFRNMRATQINKKIGAEDVIVAIQQGDCLRVWLSRRC